MKCKILVTAVMMNNKTVVTSLETSNRKIAQKDLSRLYQKINERTPWQYVLHTKVILQLTNKGRVLYEVSDVVYSIEDLIACITNYVMISDYEFHMRNSN